MAGALASLMSPSNCRATKAAPGGIRSAGKRLGAGFKRHAKLDSARHCALFAAHGPKNGDSFSLDDHVENWTFEVAGLQLTVCSLPGVFAHGRLDDGTRLLLDGQALVA